VLREPAPSNPAPRKLRVAIVTETYRPEINGVAITIELMVDALARRGHSLQLIRPRQHAGDAATAACDYEQVLVRGAPIPGYAGLRVGLPAAALLKRLWRTQPPDVVHVVTEGPLGWSAINAARALGIPVTSDFHTNFHTYSAHYGLRALRALMAAYLVRLHNRAAMTLVPTEELRAELAALGMRNLRVVARGFDAQRFHPSRRNAGLRRSWGVEDVDAPAVVHVGRLAPEKNLDLLFHAFDAMRAAVPRARLIIVGDGPERRRLERSYPGHRFAGMQTGDALAQHYASGDIFLYPSLTETFGNVTVEAMASGLAVVAYDYAAAHRYIVSGSNGLLAPFGDAEAFKALARRLVQSPSTIRMLGANARGTASGIGWEPVFDAFESELRNVCTAGVRIDRAAVAGAGA